MLCHSLMKTDVERVRASDSVRSAASKMRDRNIGFLPVCDENERVVGTITDRDIVIRLVADGHESGRAVADAMTPEAVCCRPWDDVKRAQALMGQHRKSRIMCVDDDGRLVGVISLSDIARRGDPPLASETLRQVTAREVDLA